MKVIDQAFLSFAKNYFQTMEELESINASDRIVLMDNNVALMRYFGQSVFLGNDLKSEGLAIMIQKIIDCQFPCQLRAVFEELNIAPTVPESSLAYQQVFSSPWAPNISLELRHEELTRKISKWPLVDIETKKIDSLMMFCLSNVLLFSTDFLKLENPSRVNKVQMRYLNILHRYLKFKYDKDSANNRLGNGIMIASFARESQEIEQKRLPV